MSLIPNLTAFTDRWTATQRRRTALRSWLITAPVAILTGLWLGYIFNQADTSHYLALAEGSPAALPFASRQLGPLIVRGLVHAFHLSIAAAYYAEGTLSWVVFFAAALWFLLRSGGPRFMIAASLGMFFWARQFNLLVVPDLLYDALLVVFLLLVQRRRFLLAGLMMLPLTVCRESTILTLFCFLIAGWRRLRIPEAAIAVVSFLAGSWLVKRLTVNALPNNEHISPTLYLFAKMPWAFLKNFLGLYPWSNVYPECAVPQWQIPLHLGPVRAIGICGTSFDAPQQLLFYLLASFGLFPLLLFALRKHVPLVQAPARDAVLLRFTLIYGILSFVMAGLLGESFQRLIAYSWPLFLVALPILMARSRATLRSNAAALAFLAIHLLISWSALHSHHAASLPFIIPAQLALWTAGYLLLRRALIFNPGVPETHTISSLPVTNSTAIR